MGIKTVYLENEHLHKRKGIRWQMLGANYRLAGNPSQIEQLKLGLEKARKNRTQDRIVDLERQIRDIERVKVDVEHQIRPGLQRFSTTSATELWSGRKWLFGELETWLKAPADLTLPKRSDHDVFLNLLIRAAQADPNQVMPGNQVRPAWNLYHDTKKAWLLIRGQRFAGSLLKQNLALQAMAAALRQHGLTPQQTNQFWDTFNYSYLNQNGPKPPDVKAAYRAWLQDTEEIWQAVKNRV